MSAPLLLVRLMGKRTGGGGATGSAHALRLRMGGIGHGGGGALLQLEFSALGRNAQQGVTARGRRRAVLRRPLDAAQGGS